LIVKIIQTNFVKNLSIIILRIFFQTSLLKNNYAIL
jgi:hypothetical protein